jgi:hypothetical protein
VSEQKGSAELDVAGGQVGALAARLGCAAGQIVQEFGYDDDVDEPLRLAIEEVVGSELMDEDADEVADVALLWWRDDDGDLGDALVDVLTNLTERGTVLVLTPKSGRPGYVQASEVEEAALTTGLHQTTRSLSVGADWMATPLVGRKGERR